MIRRGIITGQCEIERIPEGFKTGRAPTLNDLRYFALYWDKVVIPSNNFIYIQLPQEESFISAGVLERPLQPIKSGSYYGDQITDVILSNQFEVANQLIKKKDTDWVIHQLGEELIIPKGFSTEEERNILRVDLASCLPVPTGEINIHDLLEFKEQRRTEFLALHEHLDEVYQQVLSSPDPSLASKTAISKLAQNIQNLERVTNEKFKKSTKFDLSAELNITAKNIAMGATFGSILGTTLGIELPLATVAGSLISAIKLTAKSTKNLQFNNHETKLAYLTKAHKEGIYQ